LSMKRLKKSQNAVEWEHLILCLIFFGAVGHLEAAAKNETSSHYLAGGGYQMHGVGHKVWGSCKMSEVSPALREKSDQSETFDFRM
jgi:hypothetical protein